MAESVATALQENFGRQVSVDEMADAAGISRHHYSRRFKFPTGQSPYQFAIQGKLQHAFEKMKQEEKASILSTARSIGYNSPSQFSKLFKKRFGFSPQIWPSTL